MKLLDLVVQEFISIIEYVQLKHDVENNRIILERDEFRNIMEKYGYVTFAKKCSIYKQLNLLVHDGNNYTMPCKVKGKTVRRVVLNYTTYLILKELYTVVK